MLLAGPPGVGKTLTSESVAEDVSYFFPVSTVHLYWLPKGQDNYLYHTVRI